ncbi:MAG: nucleotidyl transferase AbiEii/AbiGii toxin family protein [Sphingobacteriales bacterium]|nr:nucleotidyl transferase AbiEii/AbiGii toxin family protein [Sphingobacteriales bacterium]
MDYLHNHKDFYDLLRILEEEKNILAGLIEKDYWIMHVLNGLKKQGFVFELKGGTSLSKGYKIIDRFSEDIDIHIKPTEDKNIDDHSGNNKKRNVQLRKEFYDWLAKEIKIDGIVSVERDTTFDDPKYYRSGGIRLKYESKTSAVAGLKEGILLEAGFDTVTPNSKLNIGSWALDKANENKSVRVYDNTAYDITCYHPGYTLVEKLQTIATKFRQEKTSGELRSNYMRQYYDVYCLLADRKVNEFIGTAEYTNHKNIRFPKKDLAFPIAANEAFLLSSTEIRDEFRKRYKATANLYYKGQPDFDLIIEKINEHLLRL